LKVEDWSEVDEDVVEIRIVVADDLESIKDIVEKSIRLCDQVLGRRDLVLQATRSNHSTCEVALVDDLVSVVTLGNGLIDVDVPVLGEHRTNLEFRQSPKLKLESGGRFVVANACIFVVGWATESKIARVGTFLVSADEGDATNFACQEL